LKYSYAQQESRYQRLRQLGRAVDYAGESFDYFDLRPFLEQLLPSLHFTVPCPRVLEYGTGTGPGACFLAARGFQVNAIDISPTAITLAKTFAAERNLQVNYQVQDICELRGYRETYDLVIDNFCLHRLVSDQQRQIALNVVRSIIKPLGWYVIGTVLFHEDRTFRKDKFDESTGVVYDKLGLDPQGYDDAVQCNGHWFVPRAKHVRADQLKAELETAGFRVIRQDGGKVLCRPE
jgi:2-polyprenyl-3-methyl-5-hydroxy-6-metoxy-1,4-benzoquinol methylase